MIKELEPGKVLRNSDLRINQLVQKMMQMPAGQKQTITFSARGNQHPYYQPCLFRPGRLLANMAIRNIQIALLHPVPDQANRFRCSLPHGNEFWRGRVTFRPSSSVKTCAADSNCHLIFCIYNNSVVKRK